MAKKPTGKPPQHRAPGPPQAQSRNPVARNPNFNQQTRKMLSKHYRAKYGVK